MNRAVRYTCSIFGLITVFSLGNYFCYESAMNHFQEMQEDYESRLGEQVQVYVSKEMETQKEELEQWAEESIAANSTENKLSENTIYQIQSYDNVTDTTTTDYEELPDDMVGYTREDVEAFCQEYMNNMPVEDFLNGLQSMNVSSFSSDRLVVRKLYDISKVKFRYYLIASQGEVVVYYGDMKTIYEKTGISTDSLSKADRKALKNGIEVKDEEELFGILENYSS
ncbi:MAG: BofC C-terminal domain-containing protein [Lachnospiraceae bacterium]|nr:BofC C-terminal domain-containing protein [Lachnospiraceae bacterium]